MTGDQPTPTETDHMRHTLEARRTSLTNMLAGSRIAYDDATRKASLPGIHHTYRDAYENLAAGYENDIVKYTKRLDTVNAALAGLG